MAYKCLVRAVLEYSSAAWDTYAKDNIYKVEMVYRSVGSALSQVGYRNTSSISEMLKDLQWDTMEERRKRNRQSMFYKIHIGQTGIDTRK